MVKVRVSKGERITKVSGNLLDTETIKRLREKVKNAKGKVGFIEGGLSSYPKKEGDFSGKPPPDVLDTALWNEFGVPQRGIPERPFMRNANVNFIVATRKLRIQLAKAIVAGDKTVEEALSLQLLELQATVQEEITDLREPPNAPFTIKQKKSDNPLIDTGLMRSSVTWELDES